MAWQRRLQGYIRNCWVRFPFAYWTPQAVDKYRRRLFGAGVGTVDEENLVLDRVVLHGQAEGLRGVAGVGKGPQYLARRGRARRRPVTFCVGYCFTITLGS